MAAAPQLTSPTLGKLAIFCGVALVMFSAAGVSATMLPQFTVFYVAGGSGITAIIAGFLLGAVQLDDR